MISFKLMAAGLLYRVDDSLECLRIIHGEVCQYLAVQADILLCDAAHELGIGKSVLTCGSDDTLDPEGTEFSLLGFSVTVCISETFFIGVLRNRPDISPGKEVTAGSLENLLAACP